MTFTLAIVGRPNVGKSTLFNRLVGKRLALVDDQPGVTRDLREGAARLADLRFTVIDTAGLEDATDDSLQGRMRRLTERAVDMADVCLFMIDARTGVTPTDEIFADIARRPEQAARKTLAYLQRQQPPEAFITAARNELVRKGSNAHDYKYASAVLQDFTHVSPAWRDRYLAASIFNLHGYEHVVNPLVERIRAALKG